MSRHPAPYTQNSHTLTPYKLNYLRNLRNPREKTIKHENDASLHVHFDKLSVLLRQTQGRSLDTSRQTGALSADVVTDVVFFVILTQRIVIFFCPQQISVTFACLPFADVLESRGQSGGLPIFFYPLHLCAWAAGRT